MARFRDFRSANPALKKNPFADISAALRGEVMTIDGTVNKTALSLIILIISASWTWNMGMAGEPFMGWVMAGFIGGFVVAMITMFKMSLAPYTTPLYAAFEGVALGGISVAFEAQYPGIASQAVFLTFGTLGALLAAYRFGLIRATEKFKMGVFAATGGIAVVYLLNFIFGLFGGSIPLIHSSGSFGILFSCAVVVIAALNLVLDFDFIEQGAAQGAPKYMEWYGAFGLLLTLVWLYMEILRLLAKLRSDD
ncbi:MAG: Bax inhibitor-1/YccA family protein [Nitrospiria bacterium]